jgi:hypothetical protein
MKRLGAALVVTILGLAGCGGGSGSPGGVDGTKQIAAVSSTEKESLCDWYVAKVGGYGAQKACAEGPLGAPPNKADCVSKFPSCAVTVSQFAGCIDAIVVAEATCTSQSLASIMSDPDCQVVVAAGCFGGGDGGGGGGN